MTSTRESIRGRRRQHRAQAHGPAISSTETPLPVTPAPPPLPCSTPPKRPHPNAPSFTGPMVIFGVCLPHGESIGLQIEQCGSVLNGAPRAGPDGQLSGSADNLVSYQSPNSVISGQLWASAVCSGCMSSSARRNGSAAPRGVRPATTAAENSSVLSAAISAVRCCT